VLSLFRLGLFGLRSKQVALHKPRLEQGQHQVPCASQQRGLFDRRTDLPDCGFGNETEEDENMETFAGVLTIFVLALFVGFEVITKVPPVLHTPLMSGSNAISGITLIGAILSAGAQQTGLTTVLGFLAVLFATINVVGGFLVTHRMLGMFKRRG
jgi:proton-translocating NAD(P)+ transhydrogenase subunit alpha